MKSRTILSVVGLAVVMLVIGTTLGSLVFPMTKTTTQTVSKASSNSSELYELRFNQTSPCSPPFYLIPWSVTLGNGMSIAEPSPRDNFSECCAGSQSYTNYSSIVFSVPNGNYTFSTNGPQFFTESGNVTVDGKDVTVMLEQEIASCGSITTSSSG
jgi:hypothetical protein